MAIMRSVPPLPARAVAAAHLVEPCRVLLALRGGHLRARLGDLRDQVRHLRRRRLRLAIPVVVVTPVLLDVLVVLDLALGVAVLHELSSASVVVTAGRVGAEVRGRELGVELVVPGLQQAEVHLGSELIAGRLALHRVVALDLVVARALQHGGGTDAGRGREGEDEQAEVSQEVHGLGLRGNAFRRVG